MLNKVWNALSPDDCLTPYKADYKWLSKVYDSIRPGDDSGKLIWAALGSKTLQLVHQTHAALMAAVAEDDAGQQAMTETQPEPEQEQPVAGQTTIRVLIKSSGGKVNIRTGNGTSYSRITAVAPGTTLEYVASAFNGWQAVKIGSQVGWVSGEYSEITSE